VEIEKPRPGIERLYSQADYLLFSRHFAMSQGHATAMELLKHIADRTSAEQLICTWGEQGAYAIDRNGEALHADAIKIPTIVDSIGAGDTFNAGFIHARLRGDNLLDALRYACFLAGNKCTLDGLNQLGQFKDKHYD
jgi:ketohexokinase